MKLPPHDKSVSLWGQSDVRARAAAQGLSRQTGASARFATPAEMLSARWRYEWRHPTILLGTHEGQPVGLAHDDRHLLTVAGSRAGKGVSLIVPNLVLWPGSALVLDPKGELARMTARARRQLHGQDVHVLDPFGVSGQPTSSCNPLDAIDLNSPRLGADLALLGESLFTSTTLSNADHWVSGAAELWTAATLYAKCYFYRPTLVTVRDIIAGKHGTVAGSIERPSEIFGSMLESDALDGLLRQFAIQWLEIPEKEQGSILSTARRQTFWLDGFNNADAAMTRVLAPSDLSLRDLKRKPTTIYLCVPASDMNSHRAFLRVFVNMAMAALEGTPSIAGAPPTLLLLDEFATALGHMASLEKAAGLMAGAGVKLWPILQDLGQLKAHYRDSWETFIGNAGVTTWHGIADATTAEYVAGRLGQTQYQEAQPPSGSFSDVAHSGLLRRPTQWVSAPLLYPHEIERGFARETGRLLAMSPGSPPLILDRCDIRHGFLKEWIDDSFREPHR